MTAKKEIAFLLEATSISPDANQISRMREHIESGIDWSELLRIAIPHGVLPLLSRNLIAHASTVIPGTTLLQLQRFSKRVADRNREQSIELARLVSALSKDGFRVLPFKGPVLALNFYGDMDVRESHDLDLWIDPTQFVRAMKWFVESGYRPVHHVRGVPQELTTPREKLEEFWSPDGKVVVEIKAHIEWSEASLFDPPFEEAWSRRGHTVINEVEMGLIAAEDLLPSLAAHGSKHFWRRLNWIVDIAAVISSCPALEWNETMSRATEWRCRRRLLTAVALAADFYGAEIPPAIRREVQHPAIRSAVAHIRSGIFEQKAHTFAGLGADFIYCLRSSDSISERLRYVRTSRHFIGRIFQADESRMMIPMSGSVRQVYGAFTRVRSWLGATGSKSR